MVVAIAACALALLVPAAASADIGFVGKWGSEGSGDGQFIAPKGLTIDSAGDVYVVDNNGLTSRVQKFTSAGGFITKWGSAGSGAGQFYPWGIAAVSPSDVYVVDEYNKQVDRFTSTVPPSAYSFSASWGSAGIADGELAGPRGVAIDSSGNFLVAEFGNDRVQKFTAGGTFLDNFGGDGNADGEMNQPSDVAVGPDGTIYVADTSNHRVQRFSAAGTFLGKWGGAGSAPGQLVHPSGVATDSAGNVYVSDSGNDRVQKFTASGSFIASFGGSGSGDGQMEWPEDLVVDSAGTIFVVDTGNHRVQKFAEGGAPISTSPAPPASTPTPKAPKKKSGLWRLIPPGPGCETKNGQSCFVEIVIPEAGEVTASTPGDKGASTSAAGRKQAKPGIRPTKRQVAKAGKLRLQLRLNSAAKRIVNRKGKVAVRVRLTFTPRAGEADSTTRTVTFKKQPRN